jgi:hypothetical protein
MNQRNKNKMDHQSPSTRTCQIYMRDMCVKRNVQKKEIQNDVLIQRKWQVMYKK